MRSRADVAVDALFGEIEKLGGSPKGMKVLYVGSEFGAGHKAQADNLEAAAKLRDIPVEKIDFHRTFGKPKARHRYEKAVGRHLGELGVRSGANLAKEHARYYATGVDRDKLRDFAEANRDQALVVTMPHLQQAMQGVKNPVHVLHTDPKKWTGETAISPLQRGKRIHLGTRAAMQELKGPDEKKPLSGLPVHPSVLKRGPRTGLMSRKDYNVTVSGGALGLEVLPMTKRVLQGDLPPNARVHAVAGKNSKLKAQLERLSKKDPRVQAHGFAPLSGMMREADLNVIRSHGTTFQESVAAGKPAVYYAPRPKLVDYQGKLTKDTAEHGQKTVGNPAAIGLTRIPGAVSSAYRDRASLGRKARLAKRRMGNPADQAVKAIMRPRPEYEKQAQVAATPGEVVQALPTIAERVPPAPGRPQIQPKPGLIGFLQKAGPGIGGVLGTLYGLRRGHLRGLRGAQLLKPALAGLGTGATIGWVPGMAGGVVEGIQELK